MFPSATLAVTNDLALRNITFSSKTLFAGDTVRVYASVVNNGSEDELARVSFFQGATAIGNTQPVSVRANGLADEVFVNFVVPAQQFNIRAIVLGDEPGDEVSSNNELTTTLFTPIPDADRDHIADSSDNCPNSANADQTNSDNDTLGDVCDSDDDNDGIADETEIKNGTDPLKADTDNDGVNDAQDAYPTDSSRSKIVVASPPAPPQPPKTIATNTVPETTKTTATQQSTPSSNADTDQSNLTALLTVSEKIIPLVPEINSAPSPLKTDAKTAETANVANASPFWRFGNPVISGVLGLLLIASAGFLIAERKVSRNNFSSASLPDEPLSESPKEMPIATKKPKTRLTAKRKSLVKKIKKTP